jgi:RHS repeat-associated protein
MAKTLRKAGRHDAADQLLSATVTNAGNLINPFTYAYDPSGNRLTEQVGASNSIATYNALNQLSTSTAPGASRTNEWDARDRLVAINSGNQRTEFTYDGMDRMVSIRQLTNAVEASFRRFVWCGNKICEERNAVGAVTKRYFQQGMKLESGPNTGNYFYTRDHLGSIRELTDAGGNVRARYAYDSFGRRSKSDGDLEADFGFTGLFFASEAGLSVARFRTYDAIAGRWLSRDPLRQAELDEGPNLYAYVGNNPVNLVDPLGLAACCEDEKEALDRARAHCPRAYAMAKAECELAWKYTPEIAEQECADAWNVAQQICEQAAYFILEDAKTYLECLKNNKCEPSDSPCGGPSGPGPKPNLPLGGGCSNGGICSLQTASISKTTDD